MAIMGNADACDRALVIFARSPVAGKSKTRLIPLLGPERAARFQLALSLDALSKIRKLQSLLAPYLAVAGPAFSDEHEMATLNQPFRLLRQQGTDLGERLRNAFRLLLETHTYVVVIGTDSPELPPSAVRRAFDILRSHQAVIGPCPDGGYYLIGLRRGLSIDRLRDVFRGVRLGTRWALRDSLANFRRLGLDCATVEMIADIDRPSDLRNLFERMSRNSSHRRHAPNTWRFLTALNKHGDLRLAGRRTPVA